MATTLSALAPLWTPSRSLLSQSRLKQYMDWLFVKKGLYFRNYDDLWEWSVTDLEHFWVSITQFFGIQFTTPYHYVIQLPGNGGMIGTRWFGGATLNYAEHVFRQHTPYRPALLYAAEQQGLREMSWTELAYQVAALSTLMRTRGVGPGDRVVAVLPNGPEAVVSFLATAAVGAIWSLSSPDVGSAALIDRFEPLEPTLLIAVESYTYNGRSIDKTETIDTLLSALPTLTLTLRVAAPDGPPASASRGGTAGRGYSLPAPSAATVYWEEMLETDTPDGLVFEPLPFDHPLWVLYSSGTAGRPKAITHSVGGCLLEHVKALGLHQDVRPGERYCWYSVTGGMMWNLALGSLLVGATLVLYDGAPAYPSLTRVWEFIDRAQVHHFGGSTAYLLTCMRSGIRPIDDYRSTALRSVSATGAPLPADAFYWLLNAVKTEVWPGVIGSDTEICSAFLGPNPLLPVYAGEMQCRLLGCKADVLDDDGQPLRNQPGELVVRQPMPSMPLYFWNDSAGEQYQQRYFGQNPAVWRHGDWVFLTDRHTAVMQGRVEATLFNGKNRIGTADVYSSVEQIEAVADSLIVGIERPGGAYLMVLFVVLRHGSTLDAVLKDAVRQALRSQFDPRWLPETIIQVAEIPYTISGKKLEIPVRKMLGGTDSSLVIHRNTLRNPAVLDTFSALIGTITAWW